MANEIRASVSLSVSKSSLALNKSLSKQITMSGTHLHSTTQDVGTTYEAIVIPAELATLGVAIFTNLDATNYVEIGREVAATFYGVVKLKAGESALLRLTPSVTYYGRANTAAVTTEVTVIED